MRILPFEKQKKANISMIMGFVLCIILIPVLIVNLIIIIESYIYKDEVPGFLGYKPFIVLSGSMEPEFHSGDLVLVKEVSPDILVKGDIIAFKQDNLVITHRIINIREENGKRVYTTKGDNNNIDDGNAITDDVVEGRYIHKLSGLGNVAMYMQTSTGMLLFIAVPLILFVLYDIFRRKYDYRRERKQTAEIEEELARMKKQLEEARNNL